MARRTAPQVLVSTGLFLAAAARTVVPSARKLSTFKWEKDNRRLINDEIRFRLADCRDADRQIGIAMEQSADLRAKAAKYERILARADVDADTAELAADMLAAVSAELVPFDARIAEAQAAKISDDEIAAALAIAAKRTAGDSDWARAAREFLASDTIDLCDQRAVGCLSRAACK